MPGNWLDLTGGEWAGGVAVLVVWRDLTGRDVRVCCTFKYDTAGQPL